MKKVLSTALILTTMFNQVGANCLAVEASKPQKVEKQVELQAKENVPQSDEELQRVVDQVLVELKKRADSKSDVSKKAEQSKSSLPVRALKGVGKAGVFVVKQFLWLTFVALMSILGSAGTTLVLFATGEVGIKEAGDLTRTVNDSLVEMNKLIEHLEENPELAQGILSEMFNLLRNCKESMQPNEFKSYLKNVAMLFHPDKLKNLRNISEEKANEIYQLTTELMNKQ